MGVLLNPHRFGAAPIDPQSIGSLIAEFLGDQGAYKTSGTGSPCTTTGDWLYHWDDINGVNLTGAQPFYLRHQIAANNPNWIASALNSKGVARFDADGSDALKISTHPTPFASNPDNESACRNDSGTTLFLVAKTDAASGGIIGTYSNVAGSAGWQFRAVSGNLLEFQQYDSGVVSLVTVTSTTAFDSNYVIFCVTYTGDTTSNGVKLYANDSLEDQGTCSGTVSAHLQGQATLTVGMRDISPATEQWDGQIAAFLTFDAVLSSTDRTGVYTWLKDYWGL